MTNHDWLTDAACAGADPELFYVKADDTARARTTIATFCRTCPVKAECLEAELAVPGNKGRHHIRGGLTPRGIGRVATKRRQAQEATA